MTGAPTQVPVLLGLASLVVGSIAACSSGGTDRSTSEPAHWEVDSSPSLRIPGSGEDGSLLVGYPAAGTRLPDGTIVIGDRATVSVRFFDSSGRLVREVGRSGSGPGEFANVKWLGRCARDSIFVWDGRHFRMTVIAVPGSVTREFRFPPEVTSPPAQLACTSGGFIALQQFPLGVLPPASDGSSPHYRAPVLLANDTGMIVARFGDLPAFESRPLGKATWVAVTSARLYVGTAESTSIDVYQLDGTKLPTIYLPGSLRPVTERHYERVINQLVAPYSNTTQREEMRRYLRRLPPPEHLPPYTGLFTDSAGSLWVLTSVPGDGETRFDVFDALGSQVAIVSVPAEIRVFEVGHDYVLGANEAPSGEPQVLLYTVRRSS